MQLYDDTLAPNPRRVRVFLAEKGITGTPIEQVSVIKGQHKTEAYKKISPLSQVPAFETGDGRHLTESIAICRYFEALHPDPPLMGRDPFDQAEIEMWQRRIEFGLMSNIALSFRHCHPAMKDLESQNKEWGELCARRAFKFMSFLDGHLESNEFLASSGFSIADITGLISLDFGALAARITISPELKNLKSWHEKLAARPSAKA